MVRPIGGFVFGHIGDRIGRKRSPGAHHVPDGRCSRTDGSAAHRHQIGVIAPILLLLLRIVAGLRARRGMGRRGAARRGAQHAEAARLRRPASQVGLALGLALGTGVFALLQTAMSAEAFLSYGWRIAFLFSIVLVVLRRVVVRLKASEDPGRSRSSNTDDDVRGDAADGNCSAVRRCARRARRGMPSRWGEGAAFNTWGVFAIAYATSHDRATAAGQGRRADRGDRGRC